MNLPTDTFTFAAFIMANVVPIFRLLSIDVYHKSLRFLLAFGVIMGATSLVLLAVFGNPMSLLLLCPILQIGWFKFGDVLYLKWTGAAIFEADENSFREEENRFWMGVYVALLLTVSFFIPGIVFLIFQNYF